MARCVLTLSMILCAATAAAVEPAATATFTGSTRAIPMIRRDSQLLLDAVTLAEACQWEAKVAGNGKLLILCRPEPEDFCVPVTLEEDTALERDGRWFVDGHQLADALSLSIEATSQGVSITRVHKQKPAAPLVLPGQWGEGRGFQVGQTLPDIPLLDMQGREVRFSQFLGKRYILFCWASW